MPGTPVPAAGFNGLIASEVLEIDPERLLRISWRDANAGNNLSSTVTWTLLPEGSGTRFFHAHEGFDPEEPSHVIAHRIMGGGCADKYSHDSRRLWHRPPERDSSQRHCDCPATKAALPKLAHPNLTRTSKGARAACSIASVESARLLEKRSDRTPALKRFLGIRSAPSSSTGPCRYFCRRVLRCCGCGEQSSLECGLRRGRGGGGRCRVCGCAGCLARVRLRRPGPP
ncbi:SRPBCC family protein [Arthrobacter sp. H-02-3]|uniref:SRPBCC family protein n=1 Tax=Arthrobacter sp. H-02-3 TaxID=2703675 RepID=UPI00192A2144